MERQENLFNIEEWTPKTKLGIEVKNRRITSIEQIFEMGKSIREVEIIDALLPNLENVVLDVSSVQRMTKNNRKQKFRATVVIGDRNGHVGVGAAKDAEARPAIEAAIKEAKKNIISVNLGCGSWECNCGTRHSLPLTVSARCGSSEIILKPAPRGVGIVAGETPKHVLELAGVKDVWSFARGRTRSRYNFAVATYNALSKITKIRSVEKLAKAREVQ